MASDSMPRLATHDRHDPDARRLIHLADFLFDQLASERIAFAMYGQVLERCHMEPYLLVGSGLPSSRLGTFRDEAGESINLLVQSLDMLCQGASAAYAGHVTSGPPVMRALHDALMAPSLHPLELLHGLLTVEHLHEMAWGLLVALMKDIDIERWITYFERAAQRHAEQRMALQQCYETLALHAAREGHGGTPLRPWRNAMVSSQGLLADRPARPRRDRQG